MLTVVSKKAFIIRATLTEITRRLNITYLVTLLSIGSLLFLSEFPVIPHPDGGGHQQNGDRHDAGDGGCVHQLAGEGIHIALNCGAHGVIHACAGDQREDGYH